MKDIWVRIVGNGREGDAYRPDVPEGVAWVSNDGVPVELDTGLPVRKVPYSDNPAPHQGDPIGLQYGKFMRITVNDADALKCNPVAPTHVSLHLRTLVDLCGHVSRQDAPAIESLFGTRLRTMSKAQAIQVLARLARRGVPRPSLQRMGKLIIA